MVQLTGLSVAFGGQEVLKNCSIFVKTGARAALCGTNGSGKSTLLKVIAGMIEPDSGERAVSKGERIAYLPQSGIVHNGKTLVEEAREVFSRARAPARRETAARAGADGQYGADEADALNEALIPKKISIVLTGLGFKPGDFERKTEEFSGGWQMRIALAKVLLEEPDVLLLDEPTNYLDIEGRAWLEGYLTNFPGAFLLVSHDSYFLDITVNEIYELFLGKLTKYEGNYSAYQKKREAELENLVLRYKAQQEEIKKTEALIRRFRYKASKAAFAQELIKKLEKMERIELPPALKTIAPVLPKPPHSGRIAFDLKAVSKHYGSKAVISGLDLTVESGERLLVVGPNGAGKTTLLRIIACAEKDFSGTLRYGAGIRAGYWTQDSAETISGGETVLEYMENAALLPNAALSEGGAVRGASAPYGGGASSREADAAPHWGGAAGMGAAGEESAGSGVTTTKIRDMLGAFLFHGDDVYKALDVLSGGEKARLALLKLLVFPLNLLILDEPTNHLDLYSKEVLLAALSKWPGTVVFVSHDRAFMEALSTKTLELQNGRHKLYYGNYAYYLEKSADASAGIQPSASVSSAASSASPSNPTQAAAPASGAKRSREEQKRAEAEKRRQERAQEKLMQKIEAMEAEKALLEAELSKPEVYSAHEKAKSVQAKIERLEKEIEESWALL